MRVLIVAAAAACAVALVGCSSGSPDSSPSSSVSSSVSVDEWLGNDGGSSAGPGVSPEVALQRAAADAEGLGNMVAAQLSMREIAGTSLDGDAATHGTVPDTDYWMLLMDSAPYTRTWDAGSVGSMMLQDSTVQALVYVAPQATNPGGYCVYASTSWEANFADDGNGNIAQGDAASVVAVGNACLAVPGA